MRCPARPDGWPAVALCTISPGTGNRRSPSRSAPRCARAAPSAARRERGSRLHRQGRADLDARPDRMGRRRDSPAPAGWIPLRVRGASGDAPEELGRGPAGCVPTAVTSAARSSTTRSRRAGRSSGSGRSARSSPRSWRRAPTSCTSASIPSRSGGWAASRRPLGTARFRTRSRCWPGAARRRRTSGADTASSRAGRTRPGSAAGLYPGRTRLGSAAGLQPRRPNKGPGQQPGSSGAGRTRPG
jgi:hypothetical protein